MSFMKWHILTNLQISTASKITAIIYSFGNLKYNDQSLDQLSEASSESFVSGLVGISGGETFSSCGGREFLLMEFSFTGKGGGG